jgi:hypothetical protein
LKVNPRHLFLSRIPIFFTVGPFRQISLKSREKSLSVMGAGTTPIGPIHPKSVHPKGY